MLFEDDVVAAVVAPLHEDGWTIVSTALATQHGEDIVATRGAVRLVVEAKGQGSSKTLRVVSEGDSTAAIALPDDEFHRREVDRVHTALSKLGVWVFGLTTTAQSASRTSGRRTHHSPRRAAFLARPRACLIQPARASALVRLPLPLRPQEQRQTIVLYPRWLTPSAYSNCS